MKLMVSKLQTQDQLNPLNRAEATREGRLTAKWLIINGQLVCEWIIA